MVHGSSIVQVMTTDPAFAAARVKRTNDGHELVA